MKQLIKSLFLITAVFIAIPAIAQTTSEYKTERYLETIKHNPRKLQEFLWFMPKGGDLHNHFGGASMAENMIAYAKGDALCVNQEKMSVEVNPACAWKNNLDQLSTSSELYNKLIDAWSMRHFVANPRESGHDHFFSTFMKYDPIYAKHSGNVLREILDRAGIQNESYVELMVTADKNASGMLGKKIGWLGNVDLMREKLFENGLEKIIIDASEQLTASEKFARQSCGTYHANPGCKITVRYLYQVLREQPPEQVFAQLLTGFELASRDPRVVGINMVQPEDGEVSLRDYQLQMLMVKFLHKRYPTVQISLHAGELIPGLVPTEELNYHIRSAVAVAGAKRIGHGVDVAYENNSAELLNNMAKNNVMVEINLVSNKAILNVSGKNHPILLYMQNNVPVALSTDDEGVLRTNLTEQYIKAVNDFNFSYSTLKKLVRNSLQYSFIAGESLWTDANHQQVQSACMKDRLGAKEISAQCKLFLSKNKKAALQWQLEHKFTRFEQNF